MDRFLSSEGIFRDIAIVGTEIALVIVAFILIGGVVRVVFNLVESTPLLERFRGRSETVRRIIRRLLYLSFFVLCATVVVFNGYQIYQQNDLLTYTRGLMVRIPPDFWVHLSLSVAKVIGLIVLAVLITRMIQHWLVKLKEQAKAYQQLRSNDEAIESFFTALNRILKISIWMLVLVFSARILPFPSIVSKYLFIIFTIYLIIAVGLLVVNAIAAIVDSLDALSKKYSTTETLLTYYDRLHGLIPLLRRCLEYIIYVCVTALVLLQVDFIAQLANYGPGLAQAIGIFFLARVAVAISNLMVDRSKLKKGELSEGERQRQLTITPISKNLLGGIINFIAFVFILYAVNINPIPILLSAGALGIVIGLGAQPLINDFVSGFLILFENLYLVGDHIETGSAQGRVEAIAFRTTQIRDPSGQLHILRNGQIGKVTNYSRGYVFAVVEVGLAYDSNLDHVYRVLQESGKKLKEVNTDVLELTTVEGLTAIGKSEMLIRTTTKVKPGCHTPVANQFRKLIKESFDREGIEFSFAQWMAIFKKDSSENLPRV